MGLAEQLDILQGNAHLVGKGGYGRQIDLSELGAGDRQQAMRLAKDKQRNGDGGVATEKGCQLASQRTHGIGQNVWVVLDK